MGSSTSTEEPTTNVRRPTVTSTISSHQPTVSRPRPVVSHKPSSVSRQQPNASHYRPATSQHQPEVSLYQPRVSHQQPEILRHQPPTVLHHQPSTSHNRIDYKSEVSATGDAYVRNALEECNCEAVLHVFVAQAKQRSGRAGRTQPGVTYRLYSEATYNKMAEAPKPEILRGNLEMVVLLLFSMGVKNILQFEFLDSPPKDALLTALDKLQEFEALMKPPFSSEYSITSIGRQMSAFPLEPYLSKMLIMSADLGCLEEVLTIIAILSAQVEKLFKRPKKNKMEADLKKKTFDYPEGDHVTLLRVYNEWFRQTKSKSRAWCKEFYLDWKTLEEAYEIRCQLATMLAGREKNCEKELR